MGAYSDSLVEVPEVRYINASAIDNLGVGHDKWIVTMCPKKQTIADFWQMVWHKNVPCIINLTGPHDALGSKPQHKREK
jgi:protein tyrosine phosphatase